MSDAKPKQLLHLVIGGELDAIDHISFKDLEKVDIVGVYPNYASAYAVWKQKAQMTVDNAEMRYFIVHLHRLLDPGRDLTGPSDALPPPRFFIDQLWLRKFLGRYVLGGYMRGVYATSRHTEYSPPSYLEDCGKLEPAIYIAWHANLLATPLMAPDLTRLVNLTSPHPDGRMAGALSEAYGITTISAAGASSRQGAQGAIGGFRGLFRALKTGKSVFLAAEVPPEPGRHIAPGIVALARKTGRPIIPVAAASTRRKILERLWDKNQLHLPFSRFAVVGAPVLWVDNTITDDAAEAQLKRDLDAAYTEALARADALR